MLVAADNEIGLSAAALRTDEAAAPFEERKPGAVACDLAGDLGLA